MILATIVPLLQGIIPRFAHIVAYLQERPSVKQTWIAACRVPNYSPTLTVGRVQKKKEAVQSRIYHAVDGRNHAPVDM